MIHPKDRHKCFARLACVKHAASVHPEPGSNSLKKFVQDQNLAWLIFYPVSFTLVLFFKNYILLNFQGYVTVQLSRFFVFSLLISNFYIISCSFQFVKNFFNFFWKVFVLSNFFRASLPQLPATLIIISPLPRNVNTFFWNFSYFLNCLCNSKFVRTF